VGKRAPGRMQVGERAPGRINSLVYFIQPFKNTFLSRNLDQYMPNAYLKKLYAAEMGAPTPKLPRLLLSPTHSFVECVSSVNNIFYYFEK